MIGAFNLRYDAEGTRGAATIGDFYVGAGAGGGGWFWNLRGQLTPVLPALQLTEQASRFVSAQHKVNFWDCLFQFQRAPLAEAAHGYQLLFSALGCGQLEQGVSGFFFRRSDEATGVDKNYISGGWL
jgi:hypothetical protein